MVSVTVSEHLRLSTFCNGRLVSVHVIYVPQYSRVMIAVYKI